MSSKKSSSSSRSKKRDEEASEEKSNGTNDTDKKSAADDETVPKKTDSQRGRLDSRTEEDETVSSVSRRFVRWTSEDLFDLNPAYAATARGVLNIVHIVLSMLIMTLVGAACQYPQSAKVTYFYCHSSAAFAFVVSCSACITSVLVLACCLLSKKADALMLSSPMEVLYYVVYGIFYCIGGMIVLEANLKTAVDGYEILMAGGVFAITNSVLFFMSAIWFCVLHKTRRDKHKTDNGRRHSSEIDE